MRYAHLNGIHKNALHNTLSSVNNYENKEKRINVTLARKQQKLQGKQLPSTG